MALKKEEGCGVGAVGEQSRKSSLLSSNPSVHFLSNTTSASHSHRSAAVRKQREKAAGGRPFEQERAGGGY